MDKSKEFIDALNNTIEKSTLRDFRSYIDLHKDVTNWMMTSDYCIKDYNKPNDVICFTLIPYVIRIDGFQEMVRNIQKSDLKHSKTISEEFVELSRSGLFFSFEFVIEKKFFSRVFSGKENAKQIVERFTGQANLWSKNLDQKGLQCSENEKKLVRLRREMDNKGFNLALFWQMLFICYMAAYVRFLLIRELDHAEGFAWLPDRDNITSWCDGVYACVYGMLRYSFDSLNIEKNRYQDISDALAMNAGNMFYDDIVRIADIICGVLADYDFDANTNSKMKHCFGVERILVDNKFLTIIRMKNNKTICRVEFNKDLKGVQ